MNMFFILFKRLYFTENSLKSFKDKYAKIKAEGMPQEYFSISIFGEWLRILNNIDELMCLVKSLCISFFQNPQVVCYPLEKRMAPGDISIFLRIENLLQCQQCRSRFTQIGVPFSKTKLKSNKKFFECVVHLVHLNWKGCEGLRNDSHSAFVVSIGIHNLTMPLYTCETPLKSDNFWTMQSLQNVNARSAI